VLCDGLKTQLNDSVPSRSRRSVRVRIPLGTPQVAFSISHFWARAGAGRRRPTRPRSRHVLGEHAAVPTQWRRDSQLDRRQPRGILPG
jgi:hypothetical protein